MHAYALLISQEAGQCVFGLDSCLYYHYHMGPFGYPWALVLFVRSVFYSDSYMYVAI